MRKGGVETKSMYFVFSATGENLFCIKAVSTIKILKLRLFESLDIISE